MRSIRLVFVATWTAVTLSGCSPYGGSGGLPTPAMAIPATLAPLILSPAWTPTPSPSSSVSSTPSPSAPTVLATETAVPVATLPIGSTRVSFPGGGTEAIESGQVSAGTMQYYVVGAQQGQELMVSLDSPNHDLVLGVYGSADGTWLLTPTESQATFEGALPLSEDYILEVVAGKAEDSFTLSITVAATIVLQLGGNALAVTGTSQEVPSVTYLLPVKAGQTLTLDLQTKSGSASLVLYGLQDGQSFVSLNRHATHFSGSLPASEDYVVQVVQGAVPANFTLKMKLG